MRIPRRFSNPLLRRVQRHSHVSTLFHTSHAELQPVEKTRAQAWPVPATFPLAGSDTASLLAPPSVSDLPSAPSASTTAPAARILPAQPSAASSRVAPPPSATIPTPALQIDPSKAEEDSTWKRLQAIMRKHAEKEQTLQAQSDDPSPAATAKPPAAPLETSPALPAAPPSAISPAQVQRRASVVQEFPDASAVRPVSPAASEERVLPSPVPPLVEPDSPAESLPQPRQPSAGTPVQPGARRAEAHPVAPPDSPSSEEPAAQLPPPGELPAKTPPEQPPETAIPSGPVVQPASPVQRQPAPDASPRVGETQPGIAQPLPGSVSWDADATEAPTVRLPRASLAADQPVQPDGMPPLPSPGVPEEQVAPSQPQSNVPSAAPDPTEAPVLQRQAADRPVPAAPPAVPAAQAAPQTPVGQPALDQPASQPSPSVVKASLASPQPIQRAPETGSMSRVEASAPAPAFPDAERAPSSQEGRQTPGHPPPPAIPGAPDSAAPLEAIWPVQRLPAAAEPRPVELPAPSETPDVLPHNEQLGQILQSVASGLPSESSVELVTPRKPRPSVARQAAQSAPQAEPAQQADQPAAGRQPASSETHSVPPAAMPEPRVARPPAAAVRPEAAPLPPEIQAVPTEIGPLPSDLWGLIGQPVPETSQPPEKPAHALPPQQSALQRHLEEAAPAQRSVAQNASAPVKPSPASAPDGSRQPGISEPEPEKSGSDEPEAYLEEAAFSADRAAPEALTDVIQRAVVIDELVSEVEPPAEEGQPGNIAPNVEELAQRVYHEIRRRLSVEFERWRRNG